MTYPTADDLATALMAPTGASLINFRADSGGISQPLDEAVAAIEVTPQHFGAVADATYDPGTKRWSGTDDTGAVIAWLQHPNRSKHLPSGNYLIKESRISTIDGATFRWDKDAWLCAGKCVDEGLLWFQDCRQVAADRLQIDMRGAPWADSGGGEVNDAITIVGCSIFHIDEINVRGVFVADSITPDDENRGDSALMLSQSADIRIGCVFAEGMPDSAVYLNGNGAGDGYSPLIRCHIGFVSVENSSAGVTAKRDADGFVIDLIEAENCDYPFSAEDVPPSGAAKNWRVGTIIGRAVRMGCVARHSDRSSIGYLDVTFAERPAGLSSVATRAGLDVQGTKGFHLSHYRVVFPDGDPAGTTAAVFVTSRSGIACEDVIVGGGFSDGAHWRVAEADAGSLRTRVYDTVGVNDGASNAVSLQNASGRHLYTGVDGTLAIDADIRFLKSNIGLYARDYGGTYLTMLIDSQISRFNASGANVADISTMGLVMKNGRGMGMAPLSAAPALPVEGQIYLADGVGWDPLGSAAVGAYWVWYSGVAYRPLDRAADGGAI